MKKKILCLAMMAMMVVGTTMTANAEDFKGSQTWLANFTGEKIESNFTSAAIADEILQILPGDTITLEVSIQNSFEDETDWYMTNEVLKTLEESKDVAEGGAYTYILSYEGSDGTVKELYNSDTVGGEGNVTADLEGLHQATDSLKDYFFLERLDKSEKGTVKLFVKLDGETQGNDYQDTLARLQMNFAVEKVAGPIVVQTGDATNMMMYAGMAFVAGVALFFVAFLNSRRNREEE